MAELYILMLLVWTPQAAYPVPQFLWATPLAKHQCETIAGQVNRGVPFSNVPEQPHVRAQCMSVEEAVKYWGRTAS